MRISIEGCRAAPPAKVKVLQANRAHTGVGLIGSWNVRFSRNDRRFRHITRARDRRDVREQYSESEQCSDRECVHFVPSHHLRAPPPKVLSSFSAADTSHRDATARLGISDSNLRMRARAT